MKLVACLLSTVKRTPIYIYIVKRIPIYIYIVKRIPIYFVLTLPFSPIPHPKVLQSLEEELSRSRAHFAEAVQLVASTEQLLDEAQAREILEQEMKVNQTFSSDPEDAQELRDCRDQH